MVPSWSHQTQTWQSSVDLSIAGVPKELADTVAPFDYGNAEDFLGKLDKNTGVVILEPMRYDEPDIEFLQLIRSECDKRNIVLIFDEISCGFRFNNTCPSLYKYNSRHCCIF